MNTEKQGALPERKAEERPPKVLELSEEERKLLADACSDAEKAVALLKKTGAASIRQDAGEARALFGAAAQKSKTLSRRKNSVSPLAKLEMFVKERVEFDESARESIKKVHDAYVGLFGISENEIEAGEAFSRIRFTTAMLNIYGGKICASTQRADGGPPQRCFMGLRLKEAENG